MKKINIPDSFYSLMAHGANMLGSLLAMLMLVRYFSQEIFGVWVIYQVIYTVAEMARMGFVQNGLVKFTNEQPDKYGSILTTSLVLGLVIGLIIWAIMILTGPFLSSVFNAPLLATMTFHYGITLFARGSLGFTEYVQMANKDFKGVFWANLISGLSYALILAVTISSGSVFGPISVIWFQAAGVMVGFVFVLVYRGHLLSFGRFSAEWFWKLFHYGKFVLGTNLSSMIMQRVDIIMVGSFANPAAAAAYSIAAKTPGYMEVPLRGIATYFFPRMASAQRELGIEKVARLFEQSMGMLLAINIPLFLVAFVFAEPILLFLGGESYEGAKIILYVLLINTLIKPWGRMFGTTLDAIGKPQINFKAVLSSIFLNVALNLYFVPLWGAFGAAVATIIAMTIITSITLYILSRHIPFRFQNVFLNLINSYKNVFRNNLKRILA